MFLRVTMQSRCYFRSNCLTKRNTEGKMGQRVFQRPEINPETLWTPLSKTWRKYVATRTLPGSSGCSSKMDDRGKREAHQGSQEATATFRQGQLCMVEPGHSVCLITSLSVLCCCGLSAKKNGKWNMEAGPVLIVPKDIFSLNKGRRMLRIKDLW